MRGWFARRQRFRNLRQRLRHQISANTLIEEKFKQHRWNRLISKAQYWYLAIANQVAIVSLLAGAAIFGAMLVGLNAILSWAFTQKTAIVLVERMLAGWSALAIFCALAFALRSRYRPVRYFYANWALCLPLADRSFIAPVLQGFWVIALSYSIMSGGMLVALGLLVDLSMGQIVATFLAIVLATWLTWLLSEVMACFMPLTPLLVSTAMFAIGAGGIVVFSACMIRDPDINAFLARPEIYGPFWNLPPAGWFVGWTGLLPYTFQRNVLFPCLGLSLIAWCTWFLRRTFEYTDIYLSESNQNSAIRKGWLREWKRPPRQGSLDLERRSRSLAIAAVSSHRRKLIDVKESSRSVAGSWLASKHGFVSLGDRIRLGIAGIESWRFSLWKLFFAGCWPALMALTLWGIYQYQSLIALPRFLRLPLLLSFAFSAVEFRIIIAGASSVPPFSLPNHLFPHTFADMAKSMALQWFKRLFVVAPSWLLAIGVLLLTDIPRPMVVALPICSAAFNFILMVALNCYYAVGSMRNGGYGFALRIANGLFALTLMGTLAFGVGRPYLMMRPDLIWPSLVGLAVQYVMFFFFLLHLVDGGRIDQSGSESLS